MILSKYGRMLYLSIGLFDIVLTGRLVDTEKCWTWSAGRNRILGPFKCVYRRGRVRQHPRDHCSVLRRPCWLCSGENVFWWVTNENCLQRFSLDKSCGGAATAGSQRITNLLGLVGKYSTRGQMDNESSQIPVGTSPTYR